MICGIGFTVSMFIADLSYSGLGAEGAELLNKAKLGVLSGSVIAAVLGCVLLNLTLPKATDKE
jgi:NhaA family Na+:H+ antiporter